MAPKKQQQKKPMVAKDGTTVLRVQPYNIFGKHALLPFVKDGQAVYVPRDCKSEKRFLTLGKVFDRCDAENSELCRRVSKGLSFAGASIAEMSEFFSRNADTVKSEQDLLVGIIAGDKAKAFIDAMRFFNKETEVKRDESKASSHVEGMMKFLKENADVLEKSLRRNIMQSSRMYLGATHLMELLSLTQDAKGWAKKIKPKDQQPKAIRAWIDDPKSFKKMVSAMAKAATMVADNPKGERSAKLLDDSDASDGSSAAPKKASKKKRKSKSGTSSESSGHAKRGRKGKPQTDSSASSEGADKKKRKRQRVQSSASSTPQSKRKKKNSKDKQSKRKKESSSEGSSDEKKKLAAAKSNDKAKAKLEQESKAEDEARLKQKIEEAEASYSSWPEGDVQRFEASLEQLALTFGRNAEGLVPTASLLEVYNMIPDVIVQTHEGIQSIMKDLSACTDVSNVKARKSTRAFEDLLEQIAAFRKVQAWRQANLFPAAEHEATGSIKS